MKQSSWVRKTALASMILKASLAVGQNSRGPTVPTHATSTSTGTAVKVDTPVTPLTADMVLQKADEIRNPSSSYKMQVAVEPARETAYKFEINIGGKDSSLIRTLEPSREVGKNYLMLNEHMWAFIPNIKRSIRVTLNQKLTGLAANGDISRMRWFGDYAAKIEGETPEEWRLFLTAIKSGLTYEKIRVWIRKDNFRPIKGEYLTTEGKVLKTIQFVEYQPMAGALRPTRMILTSVHQGSEPTVLRIMTMEEATFPASFFTEGNLQ